jgi:hypothetical protein
MSEAFYLQDSRTTVGDRLMFWAKDAKGYTSDLSKAHVYTREEAEGQHRSRESDVPWPKGYIDARSQRACDCQYVKREDPAATPGSDDLCYVQLDGRWNGNDMVWLTTAGDHDADLGLARRLTLYEAAVLAMTAPGYVVWAKAYIDQLSRPVVTTAGTSIKDALRGTDIKLVRPRRPRRDTYNCHGCGRFLSVHQVYGSDCPHCGEDNRP